MFLYKYRPIDYWTLRALNDRTIHFKCPSEYNDPFDCRINLSVPFGEAERKEFQKTYNLTDEQFEETIKDTPFIGKNAGYFDTNIQNQMVKRIRLSCFSSISDNILMWSHYANNHRGICLEFNFTEAKKDIGYIMVDSNDFSERKDIAPDNSLLAFKMKYQNDMPPIYEYKEGVEPDVLEFFFTKSINWEYEHEWRIFQSTINLKTDNPRYIDNQLHGIIFGLNCSSEDINLVRKIVGDQNIKFSKAVAVKSQYKVEILSLA